MIKSLGFALLLGFELAAGCFLGLLICLGKCDALFGAHPWSLYITGLILAVTLVCVALSHAFAPNSSEGWRHFLMLNLLVSAAVHAASPEMQTYLVAGSDLYFLYIALILVASSVGSLLLWIESVFCILLVESLYIGINFPASTGMLAYANISFYAHIAGIGIIPFALTHLKLRTSTQTHRRGEAAHNQPARERVDTPNNGIEDDEYGNATYPSIETRKFGAAQLTGIIAQQEKEVEGLLDSVVYFMKRNFDTFSALGFIYDAGRQTFILNSYYSKSLALKKGKNIPLGKGIVGRIGIQKHSFMSGDLSLYDEQVIYYNQNEMVNSILAVPIISEERELLGALVIDNKNKRVYNDQHKEIMRRFSLLAAALVTNARMRIYQQRTAKEFKIFYETSQRFTTALSVQQVFDILFQMVSMLMNPSRLMAITFNTEAKRGIIYNLAGISPEIQIGYEFPLNAGLYSFSFLRKKIVNIADLRQQKDKYYRFVPNEPKNDNIGSLIIMPILDDEEKCFGLFSIEHERPNQFIGQLEQILSTLVGNASVAFTRAVLYQKMERLATTDGLTELNNHRFFQEQLAKEAERSKRYARSFSLLLMDIDHFKSFNDTYGHPFGDVVLKEISLCIRQSIRYNDIPARYGGEEFAVILPECGEDGATNSAERIRQTVEQRILRHPDKELHVTVSVGSATFPEYGDTPQALIQSADKALYYSKENGRNRVTLYRNGM
ncbi:MAG: diguanylate cyclase [Chitinivibrionales bacterium]|nr:diguanylate cyclase [Chitinivibrionales bacterium]